MKKIVLVCLLLVLISGLFAKVALVLSGGGAKGFAHIGMLKVIDELGIEVDYIIGTSMGAIIGGLYASGYNACEIEEIVLSINWNQLLNDRVARQDLNFGQKRWLPTGNYYFRLDEKFRPGLPQGLLLANNIHLQLFYETWHIAHIQDFTDFPIPFKCVATNIETGDLVLFEKGSLADAMRASSSIPSIFMPIELDGKLLIDGGVSQNFPADIAKELGMDIIIGLKTNTEMSMRNELNSPIKILNQTLNIGIQFRQNIAEKHADIVISPNTDEFSILDFDKAAQIISAGYIEALRHYSALKSIADSLDPNPEKTIPSNFLPSEISFTRIEVEGNNFISGSSVRDYLGLQTNTLYSKDNIYMAFRQAFASELFDQIYPRIDKDGASYTLTIVVKERERNHLGLNLIYNQHDDLVAGVVLNMRNVLLRNSNLLISAQVGGRHSLDIDLTKNFLRDYSIYYRVFPYIKEDKIFLYNENHQRVRSYNVLEGGVTTGIGFYSLKNTVIEPYLFHYRLEFKKNIAEEDLFDKVFYSSGVGLKLYYESLNDYPYYTKGVQVFSKYSSSKENLASDIGYKKLQSSFLIAQPVDDNLSLIFSSEYGTYFKSDPVKEDPFYIGGIDNFIGLNPKELSAPFYRKFSLGFRVNPYNNFYIDLKTNYVTYGNSDKWPFMDDSVTGFGIIAGYKTLFGPARIGFAFNNDTRFFSYLSIGYDYDAFFFSRR